MGPHAASLDCSVGLSKTMTTTIIGITILLFVVSPFLDAAVEYVKLVTVFVS